MIGAVLGAVTMLRLMNLGGSIAPVALRFRVVDIIVQTKDNDITWLRDLDGGVQCLRTHPSDWCGCHCRRCAVSSKCCC